MTSQNHYLHLFTGTTWQEFLEAEGRVAGFRESRWSTVKKIKPGDIFLCYLTGISRWVGILRATSEPFKDDAPIWKDEVYPCRVKVDTISALSPETGVPIHNLRDQLSIFQNLSNPNAWSGHVRGSPTKWKKAEGEAVIEAVKEAIRNPVERPVKRAKLERRPRALSPSKMVS